MSTQLEPTNTQDIVSQQLAVMEAQCASGEKVREAMSSILAGIMVGDLRLSPNTPIGEAIIRKHYTAAEKEISNACKRSN